MASRRRGGRRARCPPNPPAAPAPAAPAFTFGALPPAAVAPMPMFVVAPPAAPAPAAPAFNAALFAAAPTVFGATSPSRLDLRAHRPQRHLRRLLRRLMRHYLLRLQLCLAPHRPSRLDLCAHDPQRHRHRLLRYAAAPSCIMNSQVVRFAGVTTGDPRVTTVGLRRLDGPVADCSANWARTRCRLARGRAWTRQGACGPGDAGGPLRRGHLGVGRGDCALAGRRRRTPRRRLTLRGWPRPLQMEHASGCVRALAAIEVARAWRSSGISSTRPRTPEPLEQARVRLANLDPSALAQSDLDTMQRDLATR